MTNRNPLATKAYVDACVNGGGATPGVMSYEDLTDIPTINGQPLKGDISIPTDTVTEQAAEKIATDAAADAIKNLPAASRTGSYNYLSSLPTLNGRVLRGDVSIDVEGLSETEVENIAKSVTQAKIDGLPKVAKTGNYADLANLPQINGKTLQGNVQVGGDQLTTEQVREISQTTVTAGVQALSEVSRTGSYNDLGNLPTLNGRVLRGNVQLETGVSEDRVTKIAQSVAEEALSVDNPVLTDTITGVVTAEDKVFTSDWQCEYEPGTYESAYLTVSISSDACVVYAGGVWRVIGVSSSYHGIDSSEYPGVSLTENFSVEAPENESSLVFTVRVDSGPSATDPITGSEVHDEFQILFYRGYKTGNKLGLAFARDLNGLVDKAKEYTDASISAENEKFSGAVGDVKVSADGDLLSELCSFLDIDPAEFTEGSLSLILTKMLGLMKAMVSKLVDATRYSLVSITGDGAQLSDRAMNNVTVPGTFYPPEKVKGKVRDFQVTSLEPGSSGVHIDLSPGIVYMDDSPLEGAVVSIVSPAMFIFTEVVQDVWYVNRIYEAPSTEGGAAL